MRGYSDEFKKQIVVRVEKGERIPNISKEIGVSYTSIKNWTKDIRYKNHQSIELMIKQLEQINKRNKILNQLVHIN